MSQVNPRKSRRETARAAMAAVAALAALAGTASAADPTPPGPWAYSATGGVTLAQSAFSDNWAGGDTGTINWVLNANLEAKRQFNTTFNSSNQLQLGYGQTSNQKVDAADPSKKSWDVPDKTTDLFLLESVARFTLGKFVDPYASVRLDTQFLDESDPVGTIVFNPVKLTETAGIARVHDSGEDHEWITRAGFGLRQAYGHTFIDASGDATESFTTNDGGLEFQSTAKYPMAEKKIIYDGKLLLFYPVFYNQSQDLEEFDRIAIAADPTREPVADFWKAVDVNFQNTFTSQITSWLNVNLYAQLVYDKFDAATNVAVEGVEGDDAALAKLTREVDGAIRKAGQFKQTLGIGLTYKFL
jgi:hypothetical protein